MRNVLAVTGDPPHVGDYPGSSGVYEVDAIGLTGLVSRLNQGEDYSGKAIDAPTSFLVGVAVNPSAEDLDTELERFRRKVDAGARFGVAKRSSISSTSTASSNGWAAPPDTPPRRRVAAFELPARVPAAQRGAWDHDSASRPAAPGGRGLRCQAGRLRAWAQPRGGRAASRACTSSALQGADRRP